jgi:hypothetical protein
MVSAGHDNLWSALSYSMSSRTQKPMNVIYRYFPSDLTRDEKDRVSRCVRRLAIALHNVG